MIYKDDHIFYEINNNDTNNNNNNNANNNNNLIGLDKKWVKVIEVPNIKSPNYSNILYSGGNDGVLKIWSVRDGLCSKKLVEKNCGGISAMKAFYKEGK